MPAISIVLRIKNGLDDLHFILKALSSLNYSFHPTKSRFIAASARLLLTFLFHLAALLIVKCFHAPTYFLITTARISRNFIL